MDVLFNYLVTTVGIDSFVASWTCGIITILCYYFIFKMMLYIFGR